MKVSEALVAAVAQLSESSATPRLDAELLMAHALGFEREELLLGALDQESAPAFDALLARRAAGEPVAYILGWKDFWTLRIAVSPEVLIPRPDSETLIEAAVDHFANRAPVRILDLGTGSGALLLAALDRWPGARGIGIDCSEAALAVAGANSRRLGFEKRASFRLGDWGDGLAGRFDLIVCNPPYVENGTALPRDVASWEPREALFAGADGFADIRRIAPQLSRLLAPGAVACIEIGAGQAEAASRLFEEEGLRADGRRDLAGHIRCLALRHVDLAA